MAWTKLKDIFATKKEINEVRDSLSQINNGWWFKFNGDLFQDVLPLDIPYGLCIYIVYNKDVLTNQPGEGILFTLSCMGQMKEILTINNSYDVYMRWSNADLNQWRDWIKIV